MFKKFIFGLFACLGFSSQAADIDEINQSAFLKIDKTQYVVIDVRTTKEYSQGHVPGAINIPLSTLQKGTDKLALAKDKTLILYCRSGYRAGKAADILQNNGYGKLLHLEGDLIAWNKAGLAVEK